MKAFWYNVDSELFTSWSPGVGRGHNRENHIYVCLYWKKIFFSRTSRSISIKLVINHPWVKGTLNCSNKGPGPLQRGYNHRNAKMGLGHLKNHWARIGLIYMEAFWYIVDSSFLKSWSPEVGRATIGKTIFTYVYIEKKNLLQNQQANCNQTHKISCMMGIQVYSNEGPSSLQRGDNHKSA
jgi:hypothetical protein